MLILGLLVFLKFVQIEHFKMTANSITGNIKLVSWHTQPFWCKSLCRFLPCSSIIQKCELLMAQQFFLFSFLKSISKSSHILQGFSFNFTVGVGRNWLSWTTFTSPHRTSYHNPKKYVCLEYITFFYIRENLGWNIFFGKTENHCLSS